MKKKKAFTLIELLAILSILGVILLIAVPIIGNIINNSKEHAFKNSVILTAKSATSYYSSQLGKEKEFINIFKMNDANKVLKIQNYDFTNGKITIDENGKAILKNVTNGEFCANGIIDNLTITKGNCVTDSKCFEFYSSIGQIQKYKRNSTNCTKDVVIPDEIDGVKVTSIASQAFRKMRLDSVEFPDNLVSIGSYAFYHNRLRNIEFPNNLVSIGEYAFYQNALPTLKIPSSVTSIGKYAFYGNALTSVEFEDKSKIAFGIAVFGINIASENELMNNVETTCSITTPYGCTTSNSCIQNGGQIHSNGVCYKKMDETCFTHIIESYHIITEYKRICGTDVVIPNGVEHLGNNLFVHNALTSIQIPNSLKFIGFMSIYGNSLKTIEIPSSVTYIAGDGISDVFDNIFIKGDCNRFDSRFGLPWDNPIDIIICE